MSLKPGRPGTRKRRATMVPVYDVLDVLPITWDAYGSVQDFCRNAL